MANNKQSFKVCFCFRRIFRLKVAEPPEDIRRVFEVYANNGTISLDDLHTFLVEFQGEGEATKDDAQAIFNSLKHLTIFQRKGLHLDAFFRYLFGDMNPPISSKVHHNMKAPLAHYFLFTGHNSYLTGNQLNSTSSVYPIIQALQRGVRVIELDLWPNSKKNGVEVLHGGTLTKPVELIKCLRAIKDNAFTASEFPVVITFEAHLPSGLQVKVAKMVTETFGDMLYVPNSEFLPEFPSPEILKTKVLISTKPPECRESKKHRDSGATDKVPITFGDMLYVPNSEFLPEFPSPEILKRKVLISTKPPECRESKKHRDSGATDKDTDEDDTDEDEENTTLQYKQLIAIHAGKPKGDFNMWHIDPMKVRRLSLSEQQLERESKNHATDIVRFTQRNLLRIYPKGARLDSSNYDPMLGWSHGAQMVAFNMQGHDKHLHIMEGMFRANGGCGYVKKPDFLLHNTSDDEVFDPEKSFHVRQILKVKLFMGEGWHLDFHRTHFDRYSPPDFFARVGIAGVPQDTIMLETNSIEDEWIPVWNEEFRFELSVPELALLRIEVKEYDDSGNHDFGGQTCLPVSELRTGFRAVPLHNKRGVKYKSVKLLMKFEFENPE